MAAEEGLEAEVEIFRETRSRTVTFCSALRNLLRPEKRDVAAILRYLEVRIQFDSTEFDDAFSVTGLDCLLMMTKDTFYMNALTVKQLPEVCKLVASKPQVFKYNNETTVSPSDVNMKGPMDFVVHPRYCNDTFAYTFPRFMLSEKKLVW